MIHYDILYGSLRVLKSKYRLARSRRAAASGLAGWRLEPQRLDAHSQRRLVGTRWVMLLLRATLLLQLLASSHGGGGARGG